MSSRTVRGYVGLLVLLLTAFLIAIFAWRIDLFSGGSSHTATTTNMSQIEQGRNAIKAAENAKKLIEDNSQRELESI